MEQGEYTPILDELLKTPRTPFVTSSLRDASKRRAKRKSKSGITLGTDGVFEAEMSVIKRSRGESATPHSAEVPSVKVTDETRDSDVTKLTAILVLKFPF